MMIDVNTLIGPYPFRHVPHPDPDVLVRVLDREEIDSAWVGHLPSAFYRDPSAGNAELYAGARAASRARFAACSDDPAGLAAVGARASRAPSTPARPPCARIRHSGARAPRYA